MSTPLGIGLGSRSLVLCALVLFSAASCRESSSNRETARTRSEGLTAEDGSTGVPLCDTYLDQYETCVIPTLPASQVQRHRAGIVRQRQAWTSLADSAAKKDSLRLVCQSAIDTAAREFPTCGFSGS